MTGMDFEQSVFSKGAIVVEDRAYFDFLLMSQRIRAENVFVTRIKTNTVFETVRELELPENIDQDILKDEVVRLTSKKAVDTGIDQVELRLVYVYKPDENKVIEIITNQLDWTARAIAGLYKKRWDIELFFKAIKQNLQWIGRSKRPPKTEIFEPLKNSFHLKLLKD